MNLPKTINPLLHAALELQNYFQNIKWPFCFIGGLAVLRWGEVRMTRDVGLCLLCGFGTEELFISTLLQDFRPRISGAHKFARQNRVLLLYAANGVSIDIALSGLLFEEEMIWRATHFDFAENCSLLTCSVEDLLVLKAFADREQDWADVEGILARQSGNLDQPYILAQLAPLCEAKGSPELVEKLRNLMHKI